MVDTILRLQIKVQAAEAVKSLREVETALRRVQSVQGGSGGGLAQMGSDASTVSTRLRVAVTEAERLKAVVASINSSGNLSKVGTTGIKTPAAATKWTPDVALKEQAKAAKEAAAAVAAAAKEASKQEQIAAKEAMAYQKAVWAQLVKDNAATQAQIAAAQKAAAKEAETLASEQLAYQKAVWAQMVADKKLADAAQVAADAMATREANALKAEQMAFNKAVYAQMVADKKAESAAEITAMKQQLAALKANLAEQVASNKAAQKEIAQAQNVHQPFANAALAALDEKINGPIGRARMGLIAMGKDLQWVGRQINFNFTLPIIMATGYLGKLALQNEQAMTRIRKVYGDGSRDVTADVAKIGTGLRLLSDLYGLNQAQVIELGASWAAAGAVGGDLLGLVEQSIKLSILGDYKSPADTFKDLITIQTAFHLSTTQLAGAIAQLNTTENMTAATLPDLVTAVSKVGGAANIAGVDIAHLSAMMAVLVPATGSAANAGNSLKTILSRIMAPTSDIVDVLKEMGIGFFDMSFQTLNGSQRLELMAQKFAKLTSGQQAFVAATIGSRWQVNKFSVLMADLATTTGTYAKVLDALDPSKLGKNVQQANKEIQTLLSSDPKQLEIIVTQIKNMLVQAIVPMLPALMYLLQIIRQVVTWFGNLSPSTQKMVFAVVGMVAAVGILAQAIGSIELLFGAATKGALGFFRLVGKLFGMEILETTTAAEATVAATAASTAAIVAEIEVLTAALADAGVIGMATVASTAAASTAVVATTAATSGGIFAAFTTFIAEAAAAAWAFIGGLPVVAIVAAVAAVIAIIYIFRKQIWDLFKTIGRGMASAFDALPDTIKNVFMSVLQIIRAALDTIGNWFSNLFGGGAKKTVGVPTVPTPAHPKARAAGGPVTGGNPYLVGENGPEIVVPSISGTVLTHQQSFTAMTKGAKQAQALADQAKQKTSILSQSPDAGPAIDALNQDLVSLKATLELISAAVTAQEAVVKPLKDAYEAADKTVTAFESSMKPLADSVDALSKRMDAAQKTMDAFANTPIEGMGAMADKIFDNEMAQKRLRLELLKMGDAGQGFDDIKKKIAAVQGDMETLRAAATSLRQAGAGSDILKVYDDQIAALQSQADSLTATAQAGQDLTDQLGVLQHAGEVMNLEQSLAFDPLTRQIEKLTNTAKELPFDQIVAGITDQKKALDDLTAAYLPQKAELDKQQGTLDQLILTRDALKATYDTENASLDILKNSYSTYDDKIKEIEQALSDMAAAADAANKAAAGAASQFDQLGQVDTPTIIDPAAAGTDLQAYIDGLQKNLKGMFGDFNPFKGWFKKITNWVKEHVPEILLGIAAAVALAFAGVPILIAAAIGAAVTFAVTKIPWDKVGDAIMNGLAAIGRFAERMFNAGVDLIMGLLDGIVNTAGQVMDWFLGLPAMIGGFLVDAASWLLTTGLDIIGGLLTGVIKAAGEFFFFWITLPLTLAGLLVEAAIWLWPVGKSIVGGLLNGIWEGAQWLWGFITAIPGVIWDLMKEAPRWLWDTGKSIVGGLIEGLGFMLTALGNFFIGLPGAVGGFIVGAGKWLFNTGSEIIGGLFDGIKSGFSAAGDFVTSLGKSIANGIIDAWNWVAQRINDFIPDQLGWGMFSIDLPDNPLPKFNKLHTGGFVDPRKGAEQTFTLAQNEFVFTPAQTVALARMGISGTTAQQQNNAKRSVNFYGDLSFPNITNEHDAEKFISNLEVLAGV